MAEDVTADEAEPTASKTPEVPKPAREPVTIEGEATDLTPAPEPGPVAEESVAAEPEVAPWTAPGTETTAETVASTEAAAASEPAPTPPPPNPARSSPSLWPAAGSGAVGAILGALLATGAAWELDPRAEPMQALQNHQAALEATVASQAGAAKALETRLAALENRPAATGAVPDALDKRIARLESSAVRPEALLALQSDVKAARAQADKALAAAGGASAPAGGGAPVSTAADPRVDALAATVAPLADRLAKLEAAQAAPKAETRVAPSLVEPDAASQAIAALALEQRVQAGEPFAAEIAALTRLGADAGALATLKPYADKGAPTLSALTAGFAALAPTLSAGPAPPAGEGPLDKFMDHMRSMVRVRAVGEVAGDDPRALASQISAALARGDIAGALAVYGKLPETARAASGGWAKDAGALAAARQAARGLREAAIQRLASTKN